MKFINTEDARTLASGWGYEIDRDVLLKNGLDFFTFPFPAHREGMGYLAREIARVLGNFERCLLLITEYGVWPSMEDLNLFNRFRQSLGLSEKFPNCLGHVFEKGEIDDIASYVHLMIIFGWGGFVFVDAPDKDKIAVFISHDSWARLAPDDIKFGPAEAFANNWIKIARHN